MVERKIIFKARVGSHLHGTSTPASDTDYLGVFLPSAKDLLGLQNRPSEWTEDQKVSEGPRNGKGDVDCKYLALYEFMQQAAKGQSQALELLFIPEEHIAIKTKEWQYILDNKHVFLSKKSILPFIGFANAQAHKAVIKGENIRILQELIPKCRQHNNRITIGGVLQDDKMLLGLPVECVTNEHGFKLVRIAHREYDLALPLKRLADSLEGLLDKYGTRSHAAAINTYDFKSVTHAFRLCGEAEELMEFGTITFPRPDAKILLSIKEGNYVGDLEEDMAKRLDNIRKLRYNSTLPDESDRSKVNKLCYDLLSKHLSIKGTSWIAHLGTSIQNYMRLAIERLPISFLKKLLLKKK